MRTLLNTQSLPLLLLLLQALPLKILMQGGLSPEQSEEFEDYMDELHATGPPKPPMKKYFRDQVIFDLEGGLNLPEFCTTFMMSVNVHKRLFCMKEHFFLQVAYEEMQETCSSSYVACNNGVRKCHKVNKVIQGMHCKLIDGDRMPGCHYESIPKKGYALITCRWEDDIGEMIPDHVNDIMVMPGK